MTKFFRVPTKNCGERSELWQRAPPIGGYGVRLIQLCLQPYGIKST